MANKITKSTFFSLVGYSNGLIGRQKITGFYRESDCGFVFLSNARCLSGASLTFHYSTESDLLKDIGFCDFTSIKEDGDFFVLN